jgi:hypothetical protein
MKRFLTGLFANSAPGTIRPPLTRRHRANLQIESLEGRQLLSAVQIGTLQIAMTADMTNNVVDADLYNNVVVNQQPGAGQVELPTSYPYYIQIDHEVMTVTETPTALIGNPGVYLPNEYAFEQVGRAADGTNLVSHAVGEPVLWLDGYQPAVHLPAPTGFEAQAVSMSQVNLSWNGVIAPSGTAVGAKSYEIDKWDSTTQSWQEYTTVGGGTLDCAITDLSPNITCYFAVCAVNDAGRGDFTNYVDATAGLAWTPSSGNNGSLSWAGVAGAGSYDIQYWNGQQWVTFYTAASDVTSLSITNGHGFYFRVGASTATGENFSGYIYAG